MPGAVYHYRISVSNIVGISWSDTESFSTHPAGAALYTATNGNHTSGANWTGAYSDLATVLAIAEPGDTIYIAGHTFAVDAAYEEESVYRWHDVSDVTLRGGYAAADNQDLPGARDSDQWQTIIARASGDNRARVMEFANLDTARRTNYRVMAPIRLFKRTRRWHTASAHEYNNIRLHDNR